MENEKVIKVLKSEVGNGERTYLNGKASYRRVFDRFITDAVLCNNIVEIDYDIFTNQEAGFYDWEELRDEKMAELLEEYKEELEKNDITMEELEDKAIEYADEEQYNYEFYQYFIIDINHFDVEYLKEIKQHTLKIMYSNVLDCYILGVDHFGTGWDYVGSDFKLEIIE